MRFGESRLGGRRLCVPVFEFGLPIFLKSCRLVMFFIAGVAQGP